MDARGCHWPGRQRRPVSLLRGFSSQRPAAARPPPDTSAFARRAPASPPASLISRSLLKSSGTFALRAASILYSHVLTQLPAEVA
jgi:hypothetical protein